MEDYTSVLVDVCAEDICRKLGADYDYARDVVTAIIEEHFGDRLRVPFFGSGSYE